MLKTEEKTLIKNGCYPAQLEELAQKWFEAGKSFYVGPENIFTYNHMPMDYLGTEDISKDLGSWSLHTSDKPLHSQLSRTELDEIAYAFGKDIPFTYAMLYTGSKCNMNCSMCLYHGKDSAIYEEKFNSNNIEVPYETLTARIDKLAEIGIKTVACGPNGELFIYPYWYDLLKYINDKGMGIALVTNGTMITEDIVKKLAQLKNIVIKVSVNAYSFETWSKLNGVKNQKLYEKTINAPLLFRNYGIGTEVSLVRTKDNLHEVQDFVEYWHNKGFGMTIANELTTEDFLGVNEHIDNSYLPYYSCGAHRGLMDIYNNGQIGLCCHMSYMYSDANPLNLPRINIDELSAQELVDRLNECYKNRTFASACKHCPSICLNHIFRQTGTMYGIPGMKLAFSFHPEIKQIKKKKGLRYRINKIKRQLGLG